jgi:uncharacterized cupin superfamily protein
VSLRSVNVLDCELDESLDRAGFRHRAASLGERVGASRVGAAVYEAEAGHAIWPYHYHHAVEEWTCVIAGAPVLRDPGGRRVLRRGDVVCFPAGPLGAHAIEGPGRFLVFSTDAPGPYIAVFPDSDKVAVALGVGDELEVLTLPRSAAVDYWNGEGSEAPSAPVEVARERAAPSRPVVNAPAAPAGLVSAALDARRLDAAVLELDPGAASAEYQYAYGREEWTLVLAGTPTLRHDEGAEVLRAGDLVCFPEGPAGAHRLSNAGDTLVRALCLSTTGLPVNVCYPDSDRWLMCNRPASAPRTFEETRETPER